uniref:Protein kinase domain-containing protein n=1 Tax=Arundo donax TaxID=35708 RepID=A0A0A9DF74_ARUDO
MWLKVCYEYAPTGSLAKCIFDESTRLDWATCFKTIKGICRGLHFLHKEMDRPIVHLDLEPANILLDDNMVKLRILACQDSLVKNKPE